MIGDAQCQFGKFGLLSVLLLLGRFEACKGEILYISGQIVTAIESRAWGRSESESRASRAAGLPSGVRSQSGAAFRGIRRELALRLSTNFNCETDR